MAQFPVRADNRIDTIRKAEFEVSSQTREAIDRVAKAIADGGENEKSLGRIATASEGMERMLKEMAQAQKATVGLLEKIAGATVGIEVNTRAGKSGETDNVTALYASGFDVTGDVVDRTISGEWINRAGFKSIKSIVDLANRKPTGNRRNEFITKMVDNASGLGGLPAVMKLSREELGRFFDLAPGVYAAIEAAKQPPPPPPPPPPGGTP